MKKTILLLMTFSLFWVGCSSQDEVRSQNQATSKSGEGTSTILTRALESPSNFLGEPVAPRVVPGFSKRIPTNDWWTSLIWPFYPGNNIGENLYAHPLVLKAQPNGLALGLPTEATVTPDDVHYTHHFREDLRVGVANLHATEILVEDYSDWTVTPRWQSGETWMNATLGHGLLFTYFRTNALQAQVSFPQSPTTFAQFPGALGVEVNGQSYGLFAPQGGSWDMSGSQARAPVSAGYFSVALLPQADLATLQDFHSRAFSFVTDTEVTWRLNDGQVETDYDLSVEALEGPVRHPALTLYRHQYLRSDAPLQDWSFPSPRGEMKGFFGKHFTTSTPFTGVLPNLPLAQDIDADLLEAFLLEVEAEGPLLDKDTYFGGKDLGKLAALVPIAKQAGRRDLGEVWLDQIQARLDNYFDGQLPYRFTYNEQWDTLLAEPVAFESDRFLNDHHFHYGYLVMGAATLARYRPQWAAANSGHVDEMILDVANPDRDHPRYPFLRHFDPYAGHSWASGAQNFAGGNNQESSSEAVHFASAMVLWGQETQQQRWVDLGAYLYSTEVDAVWEYWFDKDQLVFPSDFVHPILGILWGGGGAYATWWTDNPEEIHGINFLPLHAGSLYLGHHVEALRRNLDHLQVQAGSLLEWRDIIWGAQVFVTPTETLSDFLRERPASEGGESRAHTYHWLTSLNQLGIPRTDVTCDTASYAVLEKNGRLSYAVYNASEEQITVTFSNGHVMQVGSKELSVSTGSGTTLPEPPSEPPTEPPNGQDLPEFLATTYKLASADSGHWVGTPNNGSVLRVHNLYAAYSGGALSFLLPVDAGTHVGTAVQMEVRYDFQGDGLVDKRDVYHYFPTNDVPGPESYTENRGQLRSEGEFQDLVGGVVEIEFWSPIGQGETCVLKEASSFSWPFENSQTPEPIPDPEPEPEPPTPPGLQTFKFGLSSLGVEGYEHTVPGGDGGNHDGSPASSKSWSVSGLNGTCSESEVQLTLPVDSGTSIANAIQARIHFDFDGDGQVDRVTTYGYFPTNDVPGFETYSSAGATSQSTGSVWRDFESGTVRVELWNALGTADTRLGDDAVLRMPLR